MAADVKSYLTTLGRPCDAICSPLSARAMYLLVERAVLFGTNIQMWSVTLREPLSGKDVGKCDSVTVASFVWSH